LGDKKKPKISAKKFEKAGASMGSGSYVLRLYLSGATSQSIKAITNIKRICEEYLPDRYELEVINIHQQPALLVGEQILATPTLIKKLPLPLRKFIGDMANTEKILLGLDLRKKDKK
jgi:circadian clock protein KaiB